MRIIERRIPRIYFALPLILILVLLISGVVHASDYVYRGEIGGYINMVELGWRGGWYCCWYGNTHDSLQSHVFNHFRAIAINFDPSNPTRPGTGYWCMDLCPAAPDSTNEYCMYHIRPEPNGTQCFYFYINGNFVTAQYPHMVDGWSMVGCERNTTGVSNAGTFSICRRLIAGQDWTAWPFDQIVSYVTDDPYYRFVKVSNPPAVPLNFCKNP